MIKKVLKSYDYSLIVTYILITVFGLIMVYSASMVTSVQLYKTGSSTFFFDKQIINLALSSMVFLVMAIIPYKVYKSNKVLVPIVLFSILGLISLNFIGNNVNNAQSWISLGVRSIQPSEFVKLGVIIYMAAVYAKKQSYINDFNKGVAPPVVFLVLTFFLIVGQPDIGTGLIIFATGLIIVLCSGMNWKNLFKLFGIGVGAIIIFSPIILLNSEKIFTEKRLGRLYSYLDPFKYELDEGHQLVNSYLAIGSGGWNGVGLGKSVQKLGYLPEAHTDFIMAIIAEELGIFGVGFVILALGYIVLRGFYIGMKSRDPFGSLLAFGIAGMIGIQAFINLGGVSGLIPITGVTLPFVSYGGSSLLVLSMALGLLVNVSMFTNYEFKYKVNKKEVKSTTLKEKRGRGTLSF